MCDVMRYYEDIAREQEKKNIALNMLALGLDENTAAKAVNVSVETIREWAKDQISEMT